MAKQWAKCNFKRMYANSIQNLLIFTGF